MSYEEIFKELGFKYMGPCKCRREKGFIYQSPERKELQLWIYPAKKAVKVREWDITKDVVGYTGDNMKEIITALAK